MPMKTGDGDSSGIPSNVPAFLVKLWKLVEDPQYEEHISWNKNGSGFLVHDQATFAREILPKYFKHNNFASFVRQLNMYGFRKVIGAEQGGLRSEKDEWEFFNGNFNKYHPELLENVKRKATPEEKKMRTEDVSKVLNDVQDMKGRQDEMTMKLDQIKRENVTLWNELVDLRQKHQRQQQIVNKLFQYLMRLMYQNDKLTNRKRLMLQDSTEEQSSKRGRYEYRDTSGPSSGQPPPSYSAQRPSTQTLTISDISNTSSSSIPATSGPLITALPDEDNISHARPVIRFPEESVPSSQPIVSSPVSSSAPTYPQASVVQPCFSTGVVTFPEEQNQTTVVHPTHVMEPPQSYDEHHNIRNNPLMRRISQEDIGPDSISPVNIEKWPCEDDIVERNFIGEQVDYNSQMLENIQYQLSNHPMILDNSLFYDVFGHDGAPGAPGQDPLDALADRAAASPLPGVGQSSSQGGHELVQYGVQGSGASSTSQRGHPRPRDHEDQYVRRDWGQGQQAQQQPGHDVQHFFNG
ncbi:heat shock factor protein-like isoform X1 [Pocillopora damicornis]|uniref:heat shock factor protein-like isoform X1 n=1 Tax=Pocillopora damicornis TaxID=46731 RepID=UPI000F54E368|nr:heat shock factor protein-like isoform X1 [Pocillopora damicornis]